MDDDGFAPQLRSPTLEEQGVAAMFGLVAGIGAAWGAGNDGGAER